LPLPSSPSRAANQTDYPGRFSTAAGQAESVDTNGQSYTFGFGLTSSRGSLTKLGVGNLTLTGTDTYSGGTVISPGVLEFGSKGALPATGALQVNYGAMLAVPTNVYSLPALLDCVRNSSSITFSAGSAFGIDTGTSATDFTYGSQLSGAVGLTKLGSGTGALVLAGMNTYTGATTITAGTLVAVAAIGLRPRNSRRGRSFIGG
jgi:fibronectin-binding autotransporter adhesin